MRLYKATDGEGRTEEKTGWGSTTRWGKGVTRKAGQESLRGHVHPVLAYLRQVSGQMGKLVGVQLWEAEGQPIGDSVANQRSLLTSDDISFGAVLCSELTTIRQVEPPAISSEQVVAVGIYSALEVCHEVPVDLWPEQPEFVQWANGWLGGRDRTHASAKTVGDRANAASFGAPARAEEASKRHDVEAMRRFGAAIGALGSVCFAAQAADFLATKVELGQQVGGNAALRAGMASSASAGIAVMAVKSANTARRQLGQEPINLLKILEVVQKPRSS